jgi:hypothetical protein
MGRNGKGRGLLGKLLIVVGIVAMALGFGMFVLDAIAMALLFLVNAATLPLPSSFVLMASGLALLLIGRGLVQRRSPAGTPIQDS